MAGMTGCGCIHERDGSCGANGHLTCGARAIGACPFRHAVEAATYCDDFEQTRPGVTAAFDVTASWAQVKAKAEAIVAAGGVSILSDDKDGVDAMVRTDMLRGRFPVTAGGPYEVMLIRRGWLGAPGYGGWIQAYLCDCEWSKYNDGRPGAAYKGRMCSHAAAALFATNAKARKSFFGDRKASMDSGELFYTTVEAVFDDSSDAKRRLSSVDDRDVARMCDQMVVRPICEGQAVVEWNGLSRHVSYDEGTGRVAMVAEATRRFTGAEMQELVDEIDGRPLHNADRFDEHDRYVVPDDDIALR